jgi:serine/threonine protein kinase
VTAYEVFTAHLPWEKAESLQTLLSHMNSPGKDPREFVPEMNEDVAELLVKSIQRDPRERFQSAKEFKDALRVLADKGLEP